MDTHHGSRAVPTDSERLGVLAPLGLPTYLAMIYEGVKYDCIPTFSDWKKLDLLFTATITFPPPLCKRMES